MKKIIVKTIIGIIIIVFASLISFKAGYTYKKNDYRNKLTHYFRTEYENKASRDYMNNPEIQKLFE